MVTVTGNGHSDPSSNLGKGMNPTILPLTMNRIVEQTGFFNLGIVTSLGEGKL